MPNIKPDIIFCPELLREMINAAKAMYYRSQELLAEFNKINNYDVSQSATFVDNVIMFYEERANKTLQSYLDKCKVWKDEVITAKQLEKVLMVEEALNQSLADNNEILKLAYQHKAKFNNKDSVYPLH